MSGFILHLQGAMMSYGDTGFGQLRDAGAFPSRSAVLGILAAALGIDRGGERLLELHRELRVHVATVQPGTISVDYHTVKPAGYEDHAVGLFRQTPAGINSVQTYREYHNDAHFVSLVEGGDVSLVDECRHALADPVYTAFLGRRGCPPSTPLRAEDASSDNPVEALTSGVVAGLKRRHRTAPHRVRHLRIDSAIAYLDGDFDGGFDARMRVLLRGSRRDLLMALPRSYINRPVTHVSIPIPAIDFSASSTTNEEFFNAAS